MSNAITLLKRALEALDTVSSVSIGKSLLREQIQDFLAAEPEAEPVAWGYKEDRSGEISACISRQSAEDAGTQGDYKIPLYTRPEPARKPMTDDDAWNAYIKAIEDDHRISGCGLFILGVRFAEKHHGIIPRRENS